MKNLNELAIIHFQKAGLSYHEAYKAYYNALKMRKVGWEHCISGPLLDSY